MFRQVSLHGLGIGSHGLSLFAIIIAVAHLSWVGAAGDEAARRLQGPLPSSSGSLIRPEAREALLREAEMQLRVPLHSFRNRHGTEWYSERAEKLLRRLLKQAKSSHDAKSTSGVDGHATSPQTDMQKALVKRREQEALWLLCRAQLGCIEAALIELGRAAETAERASKRWRRKWRTCVATFKRCGKTLGRCATRRRLWPRN